MSYTSRVLSAGDPPPPPRRRISIGPADGLLGGGIPTRTLAALFGREGSGKSTLAIAMACAAASARTTTLYALADPEMTDDDVVRLAHRTSAPVDGLCLAHIDSVDDAIAAAMDHGAELLVLDSLNAAGDWQAARVKAAIGRLQRWCRQHDRAVIVQAIYDTAGRRAGGMAVAYRPDALIDLLSPDDDRRFSAALDLLLGTLDAQQQADLLGGDRGLDDLRLLRVHKSRFSARGIVPLRMTTAGVVPYEFRLDTELRRLADGGPATDPPGGGGDAANPNSADAA